MKSLITTIFIFFTLALFAQPTGKIQKDTTKANILVQNALNKTVDIQRLLMLKEAIQLYEHHKLYEKIIITQGQLSNDYMETDDSIALLLAEEALEIARIHLDTLHPSLKLTYISLQKYHHLYIPNKAILYGNIALQILNPYHKDYSPVLNRLLTDYAYNNDYELLSQRLDEMELQIENKKLPKRYKTLFYRGKMLYFYFNHNYENAVIFGKQCVLTNDSTQTFSNKELGPIYVEIGKSYGKLNQLDEGIKWMLDGVKIANPPKGSSLGSYYANIGIMYSDNNQVEKSIEYLDKSIEIYLEDTLKFKRTLGILYQNKATTLAEVYYFTQAEQAILEAYKYNQGFSVDLTYSNILHGLDKYEQSLEAAQQSIIKICPDFSDTSILSNPSKYEKVLNDYWIGLALNNKAMALGSLGKTRKSIQLLELSKATNHLSNFFYYRIFNELRGYQATQMSYNQWTDFNFANLILINNELLQLRNLDKDKEALFLSLEQRKALLLLKSIQPNTLPKAVLQEEEQLFNQKSLLEQKTVIGAKDSLDIFQQQLFEVNEQYNQFISKAQELYPKATMSFNNTKYPSLGEVQSNLDNQSILINYSFIQKRFYISTITSNSFNIYNLESKNSQEKIKELITLIQNPLLIQKNNRERFIALSHELYQLFIHPIEKELKDKTKVIVLPERNTFYLPFEVLLSSNEDKPFHELDFLIKKYQISYHYSATAYTNFLNKPSLKDGSLLAFAPVFKDSPNIKTAIRDSKLEIDSLRSINKNSFLHLPNTKKEVQTIAKILSNKQKQTILLENDATKGKFTQALTIPVQFIHVATHGLVNYKNPKLSALACHPTSETTDALFFANEIQMQDIQADLVVLSSCESGLGQLNKSEGLIALNRSFLYGGARNVLFSLWKVDDKYSSDLMINFYMNYTQSQSYTSALQQAKLQMLKSPTSANPRFWAPFVLIGQ